MFDTTYISPRLAIASPVTVLASDERTWKQAAGLAFQRLVRAYGNRQREVRPEQKRILSILHTENARLDERPIHESQAIPVRGDLNLGS